jgi:4-amino-4-deoxy-L-arabinose transferase-like glycosyltransferase
VADDRENETFTETMLGRSFFDEGPFKKLKALSPAQRLVAAVGTLAAILFVPYLGAVGLWDPWETHYGEVAREMIQRNDYVHPFWENAWFFSKPVFTMWMQAVGMQLVGAMRGDGKLGILTEWGFRMPFALFSGAAVILLSYALSRTVNRRVALATAFVLCTMPLYFLITRQSVTDTPFISAVVSAMACAMIGLFDPSTRNRTAWWYACYIFCGVGVLAKGLLGVGVPAVVLILYALLNVIPLTREGFEEHAAWLWKHAFLPVVAGVVAAVAVLGGGKLVGYTEVVLAMPAITAAVAVCTALLHPLTKLKEPRPALWEQMFQMRLGTGILVFCAVAFPWFQWMFAFKQVDDEGKLFWFRFLIHDHFNRLGAGVHTTTPGGTFTYFIEQGGYAIFPWVALIPGGLAVAARLKLRTPTRAEQVSVFVLLWLVFSFLLIGASATKFHHYVLPMLPPIAVLIALFIDRLWVDGISRHPLALLMGLPLFTLVGKDLAGNPKNFTDLFVYNYDRPYPTELVTRPLGLIAGRTLWLGDLLAFALIIVGGFAAYETFTNKERPTFRRAGALALVLTGAAILLVMVTRAAVPATLFVGLALVLVAIYLGAEASRPQHSAKVGSMFVAALVGAIGLLATVNLKIVLGFTFPLAALVCVWAAITRSRALLFGSFWALAFGFALWFNWSHWVDLSHHWTQRDLFWRYYDQRKPGEPITAFLMNWRGETFYSRNTVKQIKDNGQLNQYANQPGREWALVEHNRLGILKSAVGPDKTVSLIERDLNNKFVLVTID